MFKLMKYELRKQAFSKLIILIYASINGSETTLAKSLGILTVLGFGSILFVSFESILTYSNDLKTKCSYMLFMTPNNSYTIVGAKVLSAAAQIILTAAAFVALAFVDFAVLTARFDELSHLFDRLQEVFHLEIEASDVILNVSTVVIGWISVIIFAFLAITISTTLLSNKRGKGIVSVIIFLIVNWGLSKIIQTVLGSTIFLTKQDALISMLITLCGVIIAYIATSYMLEEKVSL